MNYGFAKKFPCVAEISRSPPQYRLNENLSICLWVDYFLDYWLIRSSSDTSSSITTTKRLTDAHALKYHSRRQLCVGHTGRTDCFNTSARLSEANRPWHKYHVKSPKYLSGILKKFLNISTNPRNISCFCFKNKPILNPLGQNFTPELFYPAVQKSMSEIVYTNSMEIKQLWWYGTHYSSGKPLNSEEKLENSQKTINFSKFNFISYFISFI